MDEGGKVSSVWDGGDSQGFLKGDVESTSGMLVVNVVAILVLVCAALLCIVYFSMGTNLYEECMVWI